MRLVIKPIRLKRFLTLVVICLIVCGTFFIFNSKLLWENVVDRKAIPPETKAADFHPRLGLPESQRNFREDVSLLKDDAGGAPSFDKNRLPLMDIGGLNYTNRVLDSLINVKVSIKGVVPNLNPADITGGEPQSADIQEKRNFIRKMAKQAWSGYKMYAWGHNELSPLTKSAHNAFVLGEKPLGATIIDSIDTLYIMGLTDEYEDAKKWIADEFKFDKATDVSVFEITIRVLGSLLTLYSFTKDEMFLNQAKIVADRLLPAFETPTGIPYSLVNLKTKHAYNYQWTPGQCSILAEVGSLHMEFQYLSELTGDSKYSKLVLNIRKKLTEMSNKNENGLFPNFISPATGISCSEHISLGGLSDSFYEYLIKESIRTGGEDKEALRLYNATLVSFDKIQLFQTAPSGSVYFGEYNFGGSVIPLMEHLTCFTGGMLALGAEDKQSRWFKLGSDITATCHKAYAKSDTKLGPDKMHFDSSHDAVGISQMDNKYLLRPETVESYFYMWRLTHDPQYRDWAWEVAQAIEKYCYNGIGYSGLSNVYSTVSSKDNVQQSFFIAETLKYLYLIFSEDTLLPLNHWVFNTEAHPFPIALRR